MTGEKLGGALLRLPEVLKHIPVSRSTFWAGVKSGKYPQPLKISARCVAWREQDIRKLVSVSADGAALTHEHLHLVDEQVLVQTLDESDIEQVHHVGPVTVYYGKRYGSAIVIATSEKAGGPAAVWYDETARTLQ